MKIYLLLICMLAAGLSSAAQLADTNALRLAGEWELEKIMVKETVHNSGTFLKEYTLTEKTQIGMVRAELLTKVTFRGYSYRLTRHGRTEGGIFNWTGVNLISLTRQEPDDQWQYTYGWAMPSADVLVLTRPYTVTKDPSGQLVRADYTSQYRRVSQKQ